MLTFTTIQHTFRKEHGLSLIEYTLCDMIYHLSVNPDSSVPGWCYMSREQMGEELGITKRTVIRLLEELQKFGFLEKNDQSKYLRTTSKWRQAYVCTDGEKMSPMVKKCPPIGEKMSPDAGDKMSPNNNIIDNNKIESKDGALIFETLLGKSFEIFSEAGLEGVFFQKMKHLYSISDGEVNSLYRAWKNEKTATNEEFKTKQHLRNSFNLFIKKSRGGGKQVIEAPKRVSGGSLIG